MNRKIIITGASGGIGLSLTKKLLSEGDRIIACANRHPEELMELPVEVFTGNLSSPEGVTALFDLVKETFTVPDVLINNAGMADFNLLQDSSDDNYLNILHTNLSSCVRCSKEAVRLMLRNHSGIILNISSVWGQVGASMEVEYSTTKGGMDAFTKALSKEVAPSGIRVNALSLGAIDTAMNSSHLSSDDLLSLTEEIPAGRLGRPEEVADMVSLLLKAPEYLNGAVIKFDGAWI